MRPGDQNDFLWKPGAVLAAECIGLAAFFAWLYARWPNFLVLTGAVVWFGTGCAICLSVIRRRRRWIRTGRVARGLCARCGYSLVGNLSGVCPECGTPVEGR